VKQELDIFLKEIQQKTAIVIGDIMLDSYLFGDASRNSPEAPVKIMNVKQKKYKIGGAGNVACNLKKLGVNTLLFGLIGNDRKGNKIISILKENKISTDGIIQTTDPTTSKKRLINEENKQLLRIDEEVINYRNLNDKKKLIKLIIDKIHLADLIIIQDYNKGLFDEKFIKKILLIGQRNNIPIMVDPKELNFLKYQKVKLIKPNLLEAEKILNKKIIITNTELKKDLKKIQKKLNCEFIIITLAEKGLCIYGDNTFYREKGIKEEIVDVTGAGDTVICLASLGFCANLKINEIAKIANYAGFLSCLKIGTNSIKNKDFNGL
tara:strand:+ start:1261 stop:2226 length:966 start_codon:yes stop_codon:yes gene_type:complete